MGGKTQTSQSQVTIPSEVLARYNSVNAQAQNVAQTPFQAYSQNPNAFVAPLNATQNAGVATTNQYAQAAQPYMGQAAAMTAAGSGAANAAPINAQSIDQYLSPYLGSVLGSTEALQNQSNQQQMEGQLGNAITSGAFGGDRAGIAAANLAQQQQLANSSTIANIANTGYNTALATAQQQQGVGLSAEQANLARLQAGGAQMANIGTSAQTAGLAGGQAQLAAGQVGQQTQQAGLTALYNQFLQQQSYPFQTTQFLANIAEGTGALSGSTTSTTQPAPFFSDEKLKENLEPVGKTFDGQTVYKFNYKGRPEKQIGLVAQDVERHHPEAVGLAGGYKTVDYDAATKEASGLAGRKHYENGGDTDTYNQTLPAWQPTETPGEASYASTGPSGYMFDQSQNFNRRQLMRPGWGAPATPSNSNQTNSLNALAQDAREAKSLYGDVSGAKDFITGLVPPAQDSPPNPGSGPAAGSGGQYQDYAWGGLIGRKHRDDGGYDSGDDSLSSSDQGSARNTGDNTTTNEPDKTTQADQPDMAQQGAGLAGKDAAEQAGMPSGGKDASTPPPVNPKDNPVTPEPTAGGLAPSAAIDKAAEGPTNRSLPNDANTVGLNPAQTPSQSGGSGLGGVLSGVGSILGDFMAKDGGLIARRHRDSGGGLVDTNAEDNPVPLVSRDIAPDWQKQAAGLDPSSIWRTPDAALAAAYKNNMPPPQGGLSPENALKYAMGAPTQPDAPPV